ncbi:hypothetical protein ACA910_014720 [Epithemia clementina (nom. ined.)]
MTTTKTPNETMANTTPTTTDMPEWSKASLHVHTWPPSQPYSSLSWQMIKSISTQEAVEVELAAPPPEISKTDQTTADTLTTTQRRFFKRTKTLSPPVKFQTKKITTTVPPTTTTRQNTTKTIKTTTTSSAAASSTRQQIKIIKTKSKAKTSTTTMNIREKPPTKATATKFAPLVQQATPRVPPPVVIQEQANTNLTPLVKMVREEQKARGLYSDDDDYSAVTIPTGTVGGPKSNAAATGPVVHDIGTEKKTRTVWWQPDHLSLQQCHTNEWTSCSSNRVYFSEDIDNNKIENENKEDDNDNDNNTTASSLGGLDLNPLLISSSLLSSRDVGSTTTSPRSLLSFRSSKTDTATDQTRTVVMEWLEQLSQPCGSLNTTTTSTTITTDTSSASSTDEQRQQPPHDSNTEWLFNQLARFRNSITPTTEITTKAQDGSEPSDTTNDPTAKMAQAHDGERPLDTTIAPTATTDKVQDLNRQLDATIAPTTITTEASTGSSILSTSQQPNDNTTERLLHRFTPKFRRSHTTRTPTNHTSAETQEGKRQLDSTMAPTTTTSAEAQCSNLPLDTIIAPTTKAQHGSGELDTNVALTTTKTESQDGKSQLDTTHAPTTTATEDQDGNNIDWLESLVRKFEEFYYTTPTTNTKKNASTISSTLSPEEDGLIDVLGALLLNKEISPLHPNAPTLYMIQKLSQDLLCYMWHIEDEY